MPQPDTPPRKSGRFSGGAFSSPAGQAPKALKHKHTEYAHTVFDTRKYSHVPLGDLPRPKPTRYRDLSPEEKRAARRFWLTVALSGVAGFLFCGLLLWLMFGG